MKVVSVNERNFEEEVLKSDKPVLMDIWAPWCGPCMMLGPIVEEVAEENDSFKVVKLNCDDSPSIAQKYGVVSIPTLLVFNNGKEVKRSVGLIPKEQVVSLMSV
ncbi:MAG: thioredoxin [Eubacteriales bacterium]|nr:thioredoxin [Eubacteriales bacterium]